MPKAVIVGGGIGGLTAALSFHHFGWNVEVLERTSELGEIGAGIQITPNGMKVFRAMGLEDEISENAFVPRALEMRFGRSGRQIFEIEAQKAVVERWGAPYLHLHRADLVDTLKTLLLQRQPNAVRLGAECVAYTQTADAAQVLLESGDTVQGDLVIGADGIHSVIRTQMLGAEHPDFTGNIAWRAVVPMEQLGELAPPPTACVWVGAHRHAVTYRLRGGTLANFVGIVEREEWTSESWTEQAGKDEVLAAFKGWHPIVTNLIEQADVHFRWALFDRAPLSQWVDGRVALLGDACHPTLPFQAQGAVMAIEDAYLLAKLCSEAPKDLNTALETYFETRQPRTSRVQAASRGNAKLFHRPTPIGRALTYGPMWMAGKIAPSIIRSRQDPFFAYDIREEPLR
ncbi:MAG: FAD-dependent monooxygenase [Hyphomonas sp.]|nr:FAD-dependent monooxygenase [Hyphomonas sp.]